MRGYSPSSLTFTLETNERLFPPSWLPDNHSRDRRRRLVLVRARSNNNQRDFFEGKSYPCLSDLLFVFTEGRLALFASFRNLDALNAFIPDMHSLITVQRYVSQKAGMEPGPLQVRARWIHLISDAPRLPSVLALTSAKRRPRLDVNDPRGYFVITVEETSEQSIREAVEEMSHLDFMREAPLALPMETAL